MPTRPPLIAVLGPHDLTPEEYTLGADTGRAIARTGAILLCGGLDGMMEAAARGCREEGGRTIGLLPGDDPREANEWIDIALPTGLGPMRNLLIARACHAAIAIRGGYGTLSEIAFCLRLGKPVIGLRTWALHKDGAADPGIFVCTTPDEAVRAALAHSGTANAETD